MSDPATRDRLFNEARYHRRARLWLAALFTGVAAVATTWRLYTQESVGVAEIAASRTQLETERRVLEELLQDRDRRRESLKAKLDQLAPLPKPAPAAQRATQPDAQQPALALPAPTSFLSAAALDARRSLGLIETDSTVLTVGVPPKGKQDPTVAVPTTPVQAQKKPRAMVI